jgi:hypothetical protein
MSTLENHNNSLLAQKPTIVKKMSNIWHEYGEKIILGICIILIALVSFEAGFLKGQKNQKEPIGVKVSSDNNAAQRSDENIDITSTSSNSNTPVATTAVNNSDNTGSISEIDNKNCPYVASKNSNKFHLASCQWAKRIKPENRICFSNREEAEKKGYQGAKCCIK